MTVVVRHYAFRARTAPLQGPTQRQTSGLLSQSIRVFRGYATR